MSLTNWFRSMKRTLATNSNPTGRRTRRARFQLCFESLERRAVRASLLGDFDGDGFGDLAIGAPGETVNGSAGAGVVYLLYGSSSGLGAARNQRFAQEDFGDVSAANDQFGYAVAAGDFNGDGYSDLAIGAPYKDWSVTMVDVGKVYVLYGTSTTGLAIAGHQKWSQPGIGAVSGREAGDYFGSTLVSGNFDANYSGLMHPLDDLAIGAPGEDVSLFAVSVVDAGEVNVLHGSTFGLVSTPNHRWNQNSLNIPDDAESQDKFGAALAAGDFNGDLVSDLAIGVPGEDHSTGIVDSGAVHVIYGKASFGLHHGILDSTPDNQLRQQPTSGPAGDRRAEAGDGYGFSLSAGDFNNDALDDLAIGIPFENIGIVPDAGAVHVIYGAGLTTGLGSVNQFLSQGATLGSSVVPGFSTSSDQFGYALAAANFNGDGKDDLAIGVPGESLASGALIVLYGESTVSGLGAVHAEFWMQGAGGLFGAAEQGDGFGKSLAAGDFNGDGFADLAIGVPYEDIESIGADNAGAVQVLYGDHGWLGLEDNGNQLWWQELFGYVSEDNENFGFGLSRR